MDRLKEFFSDTYKIFSAHRISADRVETKITGFLAMDFPNSNNGIFATYKNSNIKKQSRFLSGIKKLSCPVRLSV